MRTDEQLALRAREGDEAALRLLLTRLKPVIVGIVREFFAPGVDVDDLLQEAAIAVHDATTRWLPDTGTSFRSFAALLVKRRIITVVLTARRMKHGPLNDSVSLDSDRDTEDDDFRVADLIPDERQLDPYDALVLKEQLAAVVRVFTQELSPNEWRIVTGFVNDEAYVEIAQRLGLAYSERVDRNECRSKPVDNALQRARHKVLRALAALEADTVDTRRAA